MGPLSFSTPGAEERVQRLLGLRRIGTYRATPDGVVVEADATFRELAGMGEGEEFRIGDRQVEGPDWAERLGGMRCTGAGVTSEVALRRGDGAVVWLQLTEALGEERGCGVVEGLAEEVTSRRAERTRLRLLERALETAHLGVTVTDPAGVILFTNGAEARMHGYAVEELIGRNARLFAPPALWEPLAGGLGRVGQWCRRTTNVRREGEPFPVRIASDVVRDESGVPIGMVSCSEDITEHTRAEEQLRRGALYDPLTGLPNRTLFLDRLAHGLAGAERRSGAGLAVVVLDVDRFKVVNSGLGQSGGDQLLSCIASRLGAALRPGDTAARSGGDEFAVLLDPVPDAAEARRIAGRVQGALRDPIHVEGQEVFVSVSAGIAVGHPRYERPEHLLRDASIALHRAKAEGRGECRVYDDGMHAEAMALLRLEMGLRRGVEQEEFCAHYQPVVNLETGLLEGFEALARWSRGGTETLAPAEFVGLAEETGLIVEIDRWMLRAACNQLVEWRRAFPGHPSLSMGVNLSSRQFSSPDLLACIDEVLRETGADPACLRLEITESSIISHPAIAAATLTEIRARGIQVLLDDFGTGYSSLGYLHRLPISALKIDRSFVSGAEPGGDHARIVRAVVDLAHQLGLAVVAEGVERPEQFRWLRSLHCEYGQGYLFSPPLTPESATTLVAAGAWLHQHRVLGEEG